jgi:hypothetical protein
MAIAAIVEATLSPVDHERKVAQIYTIPRRKGAKQIAAYGKDWVILSVYLIEISKNEIFKKT